MLSLQKSSEKIADAWNDEETLAVLQIVHQMDAEEIYTLTQQAWHN